MWSGSVHESVWSCDRLHHCCIDKHDVSVGSVNCVDYSCISSFFFFFWNVDVNVNGTGRLRGRIASTAKATRVRAEFRAILT